MCGIQKAREENGHPTLGIFKPHIARLLIEPAKEANWSQAQREILSQTSLLYDLPETTLEKIPFDFKYEFRCGDANCKGHRMLCTDWEIGQSYRLWSRQYGEKWMEPFRARYERDMIRKYDTHFFVGNLHQHPGTWIIVGLFYPPPMKSPDMFAV